MRILDMLSLKQIILNRLQNGFYMTKAEYERQNIRCQQREQLMISLKLLLNQQIRFAFHSFSFVLSLELT